MITGLFGFIALGLMVFMSWRILEKAGFPGWPALSHVLAVTGIGAVVPILFFWILAFIRWPRDDQGLAPSGYGGTSGMPPTPPDSDRSPTASAGPILLPPASGVAAPAGAPTMTWALEGKLSDGTPGRLVVDDSRSSYEVSGTESGDALLIPDPSIGSPHARILTAPGRIGLEDLGSPGGTWIDGVRLLPAHGARDIGSSRVIRFGTVELSLTRV